MVRENFFRDQWQSEHDDDADINYCDFFSKTHPFRRKNFPIAFFPIVGIFAEDCDYKIRECYISLQRLFVNGYIGNEQCTFMLRYGGSGNRLIVAKVQFIHRRVGKMTELYRILKHIQRVYKSGKIEIESVRSDEMKNWCLKNGFILKHGTDSCYSEP